MNLPKFKTQLKTLKPTLWDYILIVVSITMSFLSYDLNLEAFGSINFTIFLASIVWVTCWFITYLVFAIYCKVKKIDPKSIKCEEVDNDFK